MVYAVAELLRRQRGGAAVVLGALSPRTRNAQVAMYEAGEVEYLVATDAIGMGLNMNIAHVGFSSLTKYDGQGIRRLAPTEVVHRSQVAWAPMQDGTFGPTAELDPFEPELVEAVQNHQFDAVRGLFWRSNKLDFSSSDALRRSLDARPPSPELRRARAADDYNALLGVSAHADIQKAATNPEAVRLLWDVCQIPISVVTFLGNHHRLVGRVFRFLMNERAVIPAEWIERSIGQFDRTDGDIDTLMARIAGVRTWSYITHRRNWLEDPDGWQVRARSLEDKLSDALHDRLTQRFVDKKAAVLTRRLRENKELLAGVAEDGKVTVESETVGRLDGFRFVPADDEIAGSARLMAAANNAVRDSIGAGSRRLPVPPMMRFSSIMYTSAQIIWQDAPVARIVAGADILHPAVEVLPSDLLDATLREEIRKRLQAGWMPPWRSNWRRSLCWRSPNSPVLRGLAFRLGEGLGCALRARGDDRGASE